VHRSVGKHRGGLAFELLVAPALEERRDVADEPVRRAEAAVLVAVEPVRPETVGIAPRAERLCALLPCVRPPLLASLVEHDPRGDHRARRAPHHLVRRVVAVGEDVPVQAVRERVLRGDEPRDEEDAALAHEQARVGRHGHLECRQHARLRAPGLE